MRVHADGSGRWLIDDAAAEHLDGCIDIDLESSACTNTLPVHRLALGVGEAGESSAVYLRALDLDIERLEQRYHRVADDDTTRQRFHYSTPRFDYDDYGLALEQYANADITVIGHLGAGEAHSAFVRYDPDHRTAIAVMTNTAVGGPQGIIAIETLTAASQPS